MSNTDEVYLEESDYESIRIEFRILWNTRRLSLNWPVATILRYTTYPSPTTLTQTTITNSLLSITENIVGRTLLLTEGNISNDYVVTSYTETSIIVSSATFLTDGFTVACTFHIEGLSYQKKESPTKCQMLSIGLESLINRDVAFYGISIEEVVKYSNELDLEDKRFVFYDVEVLNDDIIVMTNQKYAVYKTEYNVTYNKAIVLCKAIKSG